MRANLLDILAEPGTGSSLRLNARKSTGDTIEEGDLVSDATGTVYPIVRGIPRFVPTDGYAESFGKQWNKFREVQLDSATTAARSRQRFDYETRWTSEVLKGKRVLDAGCGAGRFAEVAADRGAELVALDMSSAIDATQKTLARHGNVDMVQASLLDPPFKPGSFDFAYCIGVAQHTPDPPGAVSSVVRQVRPGGRFAMSIYARRPWTKLNTKYLIRPLTRRLPDEMLLSAIDAVMPLAFPLTDTLFRIPGIGRIAKFTIPVANYVEPSEFSREQRYAEAVLDTFDMLSPRYDSPMTWQEVEAALTKVGAQKWEFINRVPINCIGER